METETLLMVIVGGFFCLGGAAGIATAIYFLLRKPQPPEAPVFSPSKTAGTMLENPALVPRPAPRKDDFQTIVDLPQDAYATVLENAPSVPSPVSENPWLEGKGGMVSGQKISISGKKVVLGRSRSCDIQFHDPRISRKHAMLWYHDGQYYIQDLQSAHGTQVNSHPIETHVLENGDEIRMGNSVVIFRLAESA